MEVANTADLVAAFMEASMAAEASPDETNLRSLQEICATLSRSPENAWGDRSDEEIGLGFDLGSEVYEGLDEATNHVSLDEVTELGDLEDPESVDVLDATPDVRELVREARVFIQLSLYDLAEGAVSRAMLLLAHCATPLTATAPDGADARQIRDAALLDVLTLAERAERPTTIRVEGRGVAVQFDAADGAVSFGVTVDGALFADTSFANDHPHLLDLLNSSQSMSLTSSLSAQDREACRDLTARAVALAADLLTEPGATARALPPSGPTWDLVFSPVELFLAAARVLTDSVVSDSKELFASLRRDAQCGYLIHTGDTWRVVDVEPVGRVRLGDLPALLESTRPMLSAASAYDGDRQTVWLQFSDGFWLAAIDGAFIGLLRFPAERLGRIISRAKPFTMLNPRDT